MCGMVEGFMSFFIIALMVLFLLLVVIGVVALLINAVMLTACVFRYFFRRK